MFVLIKAIRQETQWGAKLNNGVEPHQNYLVDKWG